MDENCICNRTRYSINKFLTLELWITRSYTLLHKTKQKEKEKRKWKERNGRGSRHCQGILKQCNEQSQSEEVVCFSHQLENPFTFGDHKRDTHFFYKNFFYKNIQAQNAKNLRTLIRTLPAWDFSENTTYFQKKCIVFKKPWIF